MLFNSSELAVQLSSSLSKWGHRQNYFVANHQVETGRRHLLQLLAGADKHRHFHPLNYILCLRIQTFSGLTMQGEFWLKTHINQYKEFIGWTYRNSIEPYKLLADAVLDSYIMVRK